MMRSDSQSRDVYSSLDELKKYRKEGIHYKITSINRKSPAAVAAIHAGTIEKGTGEIAEKVAGDDFNLYVFWGLLKDNPEELHITSVNFRDDSLFEILRSSEICISVHGLAETEKRGDMKETFFLNGTNKTLMGLIKSNLEKAKFKARHALEVLNVHNKGNFFAAARLGGVQLEIPASVRMKAMEDEEYMKRIASALRKSITDFIENNGGVKENCIVSEEFGF